jgi:aspartate/glutamate racemase
LEDQKSLEATEHVIEALKGKESQRYQFIRKIYQNLAIEHGKIEHEEKELMEKYIQILSEKIG